MGALTLPRPQADIVSDLSRYVRKGDNSAATFEVAVWAPPCANCIAKIEVDVKALDGVTDARLNLSTGKLSAQ